MTVDILDPPRRHRWSDKGSRMPPDTPSGCEEHDRVCEFCGLTKITVHSLRSNPYRLWRHRNGKRFQCDATPPCVGEVAA